jgi:purine-binding chemotaxis protein CheW
MTVLQRGNKAMTISPTKISNLNTQDIDSKEHTLQFLTFTIGSEEYGVDIMTVREIKGWSETTRLPNAQEYIIGVMNLRGSIIPIFDLRARFGGEYTEATPKHVFVILAAGDRTVGILVDTVSDIVNSTTDEIQPAPVEDDIVSNGYIKGLISKDNRMIVLLEIEKLFDAKDISNLEQELHKE